MITISLQSSSGCLPVITLELHRFRALSGTAPRIWCNRQSFRVISGRLPEKPRSSSLFYPILSSGRAKTLTEREEEEVMT